MAANVDALPTASAQAEVSEIEFLQLGSAVTFLYLRHYSKVK
jgi:hypothetical protein